MAKHTLLPANTDEPYVVNEKGGYTKPRTIVNALSEIQRFYVIESKSELPKEFFTIEQVLDFVRLGFFAGFLESFLFIILFALIQLIYPPLKEVIFYSKINYFESFLLEFSSYLPMIISSFFMFYVSSYYRGKFTKRAILSLLNGRSLSFLLKALIIAIFFDFLLYISYYDKNKLFSIFDFTLDLVRIFYNVNTYSILNFYYEYILPSLDRISINLIMTMIFAAIIPYTLIFWRVCKKIIEEERIKKELNE